MAVASCSTMSSSLRGVLAVARPTSDVTSPACEASRLGLNPSSGSSVVIAPQQLPALRGAHRRSPVSSTLSCALSLGTSSIADGIGGRQFSGHQHQGQHRSRVAAATAAAEVEIEGKKIARDDVVREADPTNNVTDVIFSRLGFQLHRQKDHPLCILKDEIYAYFDERFGAPNPSGSEGFLKFEDLIPIVSTTNNFDDLLIPPDHVSRRYNDTYYVDSETVLRTHTSAHQTEMLRKGHTKFLVTGDVYRRDAIDATHYPVFHQMEGFRVFSPVEWEATAASDYSNGSASSGGESEKQLDAGTAFAAKDLKSTLEGLARHLFGDVEMRWVDTYFPFTEPSYELEIFFKGQWLEVLGCGVTEQAILENCGLGDKKAWAFGLGLERLAMVLFDIPDIRLFWSNDERFLGQFRNSKKGADKSGGGVGFVKFKPFSKFPPCYKDMSFWVSEEFSENNLCELVRGIAGDLAEEVKLIDDFTNKAGRTSNCYRITYRSMERSLTDDEINAIQAKVREQTAEKLKVELR